MASGRNYISTYGFSFDATHPSKESSKPSWKASGFREIGSFEHYKNSLIDMYLAKYLCVDMYSRGTDGDTYDLGKFYCKPIKHIDPKLDFELTCFKKHLKDFRFQPGQLIVELPDGKVIPVLSDIAKITGPSSYRGYNFNDFGVTQALSDEFISTCDRFLEYSYPNKDIYLQFDRYGKYDLKRLAGEMKAAKGRYEKLRQVFTVDTRAERVHKEWTEDEVEQLWKTMI